MSACSVRPGATTDVPALARLRYRFRCELGTPAEEEAAFLARCARWMAERLGGGSCWRCWIAEEDGALVGTLWLQQIEKMPNPVAEPESHAYVTSFYVIPERRGGGVGALLFEAALDWCRGAAVDAVLLWPSARSRAFYQRYGFSPRDDVFELRPSR